MKKYIQQWKTLNKDVLKLSLICGLNWLIKNIIIWQFLIAEYFFIGLIFQFYARAVEQNFSPTLILIIMLNLPIRRLFEDLQSGFLSLIKSLFLVLILLKAYYMPLSVKMLEISFYMFLICGLIYLFGKWLQPKIFNAYLFKNVINKEYLGIRKSTDKLPPHSNLYVDADERDAERRMQRINQKAIKPAYQNYVELTFLNQKKLTGVAHSAASYSEEMKRVFIDADTIYYPIFTIHPFGKKADFYHRLVKFELSRKAAFTARGTLKL